MGLKSFMGCAHGEIKTAGNLISPFRRPATFPQWLPLSVAARFRRLSSKGQPMEPICASINETARALGIGRTKVYELINVGQLETVKIGRRTLVRTASIRAIAREGRTDAA
jgi:excisionase family DNA binding protein